MKRHCDIDGCSDHASWRQTDPVDPEHPIYLCTHHWNETRIVDFSLSVRYSPMHLFTVDQPSPAP